MGSLKNKKHSWRNHIFEMRTNKTITGSTIHNLFYWSFGKIFIIVVSMIEATPHVFFSNFVFRTHPLTLLFLLIICVHLQQVKCTFTFMKYYCNWIKIDKIVTHLSQLLQNQSVVDTCNAKILIMIFIREIVIWYIVLHCWKKVFAYVCTMEYWNNVYHLANNTYIIV